VKPAPAVVEGDREESREERDDREHETRETDERAAHRRRLSVLIDDAEAHQPHADRLAGDRPEEHEVGGVRDISARTGKRRDEPRWAQVDDE